MGGGKGVVDVEIAQLGHGGGERGVVLFVARMETGVVEDGDISRTHRRDGGLGPLPLAILDEADGPSEHPAIGASDERQRNVRPLLTLQIGNAPCRERVFQYVYTSLVAVSLKKTINTALNIL